VFPEHYAIGLSKAEFEWKAVMANSPIIVQMDSPEWTTQALHLACQRARNNGCEVALVKLSPVYHIQHLGTDFSDAQFTMKDREQLRNYQAIADQYGVDLSASVLQYITLTDAIVDVVNHLGAQAVYANILYPIGPWQRFEQWMLQRRLSRCHCQLYTIEDPVIEADEIPSAFLAIINRPSLQNNGIYCRGGPVTLPVFHPMAGLFF